MWLLSKQLREGSLFCHWTRLQYRSCKCIQCMHLQIAKIWYNVLYLLSQHLYRSTLMLHDPTQRPFHIQYSRGYAPLGWAYSYAGRVQKDQKLVVYHEHNVSGGSGSATQLRKLPSIPLIREWQEQCAAENGASTSLLPNSQGWRRAGMGTWPGQTKPGEVDEPQSSPK